jgi:hypothetical protein
LIETSRLLVRDIITFLSDEFILKVLEFWLVNNPTNLPFSFSLVVEDGEDGFACYVQGNNYVFDPVTAIGGYADGMRPTDIQNLQS